MSLTNAEMLEKLAHPVRIQILLILGEGPLNVTQLAKHVQGVTYAGLCQHLPLLHQIGILQWHRDGKTNVYSITPSGQKWVNAVKQITSIAKGH